MPADPTITFSIPSVNDDTLLECRVYVPPPSILTYKISNQGRIVRGAIVAHPYASFGGCFDDQVVLALVTEFLRQHFVVGTFNFRYIHCIFGTRKYRLTPIEVPGLRRGEPAGRPSLKYTITSPLLAFFFTTSMRYDCPTRASPLYLHKMHH